MKRTSPEIEQKVLEMYQGGMGSMQVAEKLGIAKATVCAVVRRLGGKVRTNSEAKGITSEIEQKVFEMYQSGMRSRQVAEKLEINRQSVCDIVRRLGGKIRGDRAMSAIKQYSSKLTGVK